MNFPCEGGRPKRRRRLPAVVSSLVLAVLTSVAVPSAAQGPPGKPVAGRAAVPGHAAAGRAAAPARAPAGRAAAKPDKARTARPVRKVRRYNLAQLLRLARKQNASVGVARARLKAYEAKVFAAKWSWLPKIKMSTQVAPTPKYDCVVPDEFLPSGWTPQQIEQWRNEKVDGIPNRNRYCVTTNKDINVDDYSIEGLYFKFEVKAGLPVSAFWKMPYLLRAAKASRRVGRQRVAMEMVKVERAVRKAYNAVKLAREMLFTIDEGRSFLNKAIKKVEKDLDSDEGDATMADKFRLKILKSEVDTWELEAKKMDRTALAGLRALTGEPRGRTRLPLDVDSKPLEPVAFSLKTTDHYERLARRNRPELKALNAAVTAARAAVKLQWASFWPDLALAVRYSYTYSNSDDPVSAYARDSLHGNSFFVGLVFKFDLDFHLKRAKYMEAKAARMAATRGRRAMRQKVRYEVKRARQAVTSSTKKIRLARTGHQAAKSWLTAVSQQHDMGTARAKEVSDALKAYFKTKIAVVKAIYEHNMAVAGLRASVGVTGR